MKPYYEEPGIVIYCGDCRDVLPYLSSVDLIVTSPPYNQLHGLLRKPTGTWAKTSGGAGWVKKWQDFGYPDEVAEPEYQRQQNDLFRLIGLSCSDTASLFYNHQPRWRDGELLHPVKWFSPNGWNLREEVIWDRGGE